MMSMSTVLLILPAVSYVAAAAAAVRLRAPTVPAGGAADARERWRRAHRDRRVRERWLGPTLTVASPVVLAIAAGFLLLGLLVSYFWLIAAVACFYSATTEATEAEATAAAAAEGPGARSSALDAVVQVGDPALAQRTVTS